MNSKRAIFGTAFTAIWIIGGAIILYFHDSQLGELTLNELGDFLAGATAPLAFFWLVLGYFQTSAELKQNTEALNLQREEMEEMRAETKKLTEANEKQAQIAEHAQISDARPVIVLSGSRSSPSPKGAN